ncbi:hypothetical protein [Actinopolymorpha pittospori]|uniref:Type VI protein secretion system component VasK n=1 Tax=Actinopolymorpha pittospori TaxID=648752 RepID=A0A927MU52_9ACTN|nr:hypothetical protein [Actinopolymorpha pittospori]MBE1606239.1 type VI protein secretion system component VasK [Actinopolymorpha pittospori]
MSLAIVWTALGLVGLLSAGVVVWRNAARTQAAAIWKDEAAAHKARGDRLEEGLNDLRQEFSAYREETTKRIAHLEQENATLRELVTGREAWLALEQVTRDAHAETMRAIEKLARSFE